MIPQQIVEFISQLGLPMSFGTRDADLQTSVSHAWGMKVSDDSEKITFYFPKIALSEKHLANMQHNGRIAFTIGHSVSHVCYQLKGKYLSHSHCNEDDNQFIKKNFSVFENSAVEIYGEPVREIFKKLNFGEYISVTFYVEDIFNQTPGPGAGTKFN